MKTITSFAFVVTVSLGILFPMDIFAQTDYKMLAPIKGITKEGSTTTADVISYIPGMVQLIIALAGAMAVVMIIIGGIQYMSSDAFSGKNEGKSRIMNAIWGLILAISAYVILNTLNPDLVKFNLTIPGLKGGESKFEGEIGKAAEDSKALGCLDCEVVSVPHKGPPAGCKPTLGYCVVNETMNARLLSLRDKLQKQQPLLDIRVNEAFPPTRDHADPCHSNGTCVDASIPQGQGAGNVKIFIEAAKSVNLRAVFEVTSAARAESMRKATGLSATQIIYVPGITGEHFSVYFPR